MCLVVATILFICQSKGDVDSHETLHSLPPLPPAFSLRILSIRLIHQREDYVSSCGIPLMPVVYQVVGFGRGYGRHSGRHRQSVVYETYSQYSTCTCLSI